MELQEISSPAFVANSVEVSKELHGDVEQASAVMLIDTSVGGLDNGFSFVTKCRVGPKKHKRLGPNSSRHSYLTDSLSDSDIRANNFNLIASLTNASLAVEATKTWEVGALLSFLTPSQGLSHSRLF